MKSFYKIYGEDDEMHFGASVKAIMEAYTGNGGKDFITWWNKQTADLT